MKKLKRTNTRNTTGGRRGSISATIKELVTLFGKFTDVSKDGDGKVTTEWYLQNGNNAYCLYDYKETSLRYADLPTVEDFRLNHTKKIDWGVSANCNADDFIEYVNQKLEELRAAPNEKPLTSTSEIRSAFYTIGDHLGHLKAQKELVSDENLKTLVSNLEKDHEKLRKYLDENYRWD